MNATRLICNFVCIFIHNNNDNDNNNNNAYVL